MSTQQTLLVDYLHGALDATQRAAFEEQLRGDADLRGQLATLRQMQQRVQGAISAELNTKQPPASMTFGAISAEVLAHPPRATRRKQLLSSLTALAALFILLFAIMYSLPEQSIEPFEGSGSTSAPQVEALPPITPTATVPITTTLTPGGSSLPPRKSSIPAPSNDSSIPTREPTATPEARNGRTPPILGKPTLIVQFSI